MAFSDTDATIHILLVAFSTVVLLISVLAYTQRRSHRYLFLCLAFASLALSQIVELIEALFYSNQLMLIPDTGIHLSHFLDFLTLSCFSVALLVKSPEKP
ncbi:hypothetical protein J2P12_04090 [Candidatus Bathyarchaeota archaeon]|nr:hypothetical protein [Candidatus Bathyarchaeota archaeon]